jgi:uncharacterized cupin superfamily protein
MTADDIIGTQAGPPADAFRIESSEVDWPVAVDVPSDRVLRGKPTANTLVLEDAPSHQIGLWRVSTGGFSTDHTGYLEFVQIIEGRGRLIDENGLVTELSAGVTVVMPRGWKGQWDITETLTKAYTILHI